MNSECPLGPHEIVFMISRLKDVIVDTHRHASTTTFADTQGLLACTNSCHSDVHDLIRVSLIPKSIQRASEICHNPNSVQSNIADTGVMLYCCNWKMLFTHSTVQKGLSQINDLRCRMFESGLWEKGSEVVLLNEHVYLSHLSLKMWLSNLPFGRETKSKANDYG